ncbi:MAG: phosphoribosylanthranilate isomerase [Acidobacteriota bacterium]
MVKVKICGITNLDDAIAAADAGADLLGFVFYEKSPRHIPPEGAGQIASALHRRSAIPSLVGVFVDELPDRVEQIIESVPLDLVQLHGHESIQTLLRLSPYAFKALRPRNHDEAWEQIRQYHRTLNETTPAFIVDAFDAARYGGTGVRGDWDVAAPIAREFPILLAGGLTKQKVAHAIRSVQPWGVDVSTGVERALGFKDHNRVREFIREAKKVQQGDEE